MIYLTKDIETMFLKSLLLLTFFFNIENTYENSNRVDKGHLYTPDYISKMLLYKIRII